MTAFAEPDLLETIVAAMRRSLTLRQVRESMAELEARAASRLPRGHRFRAAVSARGRVNVIAECKRRSPSRGVLRHPYDPVAIARAYEAAGAAALSILTEPTFFDGTLEHLGAVRDAVELPLLRKDFIVHEYQLLEARAHGADAVLLIVAALSDAELRTLQQRARDLGLASLVEVHDACEFERAIMTGADIVGVNNRNLRTLAVDPTVSDEVAKLLSGEVTAVSESGLRTRDDLLRLRHAGYHAFLIGEPFMTAPDPGDALRVLLNHS
ncbi:MAG: indole-3-glycerol phosphate synthase TrpC [Vicinamibacterales bacterium]